jgi:hypothetical protein
MSAGNGRARRGQTARGSSSVIASGRRGASVRDEHRYSRSVAEQLRRTAEYAGGGAVRADYGKQLNEHLLELRLPTIRRSFGERARRAEGETLSYEQYLFELVELE